MSPDMGDGYISSGSIKLDMTLHQGGIPLGDLVLLRGPIDSGKTSLCLSMTAEANHEGLNCAIIDLDQSLEVDFAHRCGVDANRTFYCQPPDLLSGLTICEILLKSGVFGLIIVDSANGMESLLDEGTSEREYMLASHLGRLKLLARNKETVLLFTTHSPSQSGPIYHQLKKHLPRLALPMHADMIFEIQRQDMDFFKQSEGYSVLIRIYKSKMVISRHPLELFLLYNGGVEKSSEIIDLGINYEIIFTQGTAYLYRDHMLGNNRKSAIDYLQKFPDIAQKIEQDIRQFSNF